MSSSGGEHSNGSLVVLGLADDRIRWAAECVDDLATFDGSRARSVVDALLEKVGVDRHTLEPGELFAILLIDGMSCAEEGVTAALADALDGRAHSAPSTR